MDIEVKSFARPLITFADAENIFSISSTFAPSDNAVLAHKVTAVVLNNPIIVIWCCIPSTSRELIRDTSSRPTSIATHPKTKRFNFVSIVDNERYKDDKPRKKPSESSDINSEEFASKKHIPRWHSSDNDLISSSCKSILPLATSSILDVILSKVSKNSLRLYSIKGIFVSNDLSASNPSSNFTA